MNAVQYRAEFSLQRDSNLGPRDPVRGAENSTTRMLLYSTDNPLYIDARYNDKIRYNDNLTVTKHLCEQMLSL